LTRNPRKKAVPPTRKESARGAVRLEAWIGARSRLVLAAALGLNLLLCLLLFDPKLHTGGDNATYVNLAQSILTPGVGYSTTYSPGPPVPQTMYPFGFPLLIAPVIALFGASVLALKFLLVLFSLGTVFIFALLAERLTGPVLRAALILALAVNPVLVEYSHWILAELPFLFFSLLTLYLLVRSEEAGRRSQAFFWAGILCLAFTVHIRSIGVGFAVAGFVYYALRRSWKRLALFTVTVSLLLAPWMIRNRMVSPAENSYGGWLLLKNPYSPEQGRIGFADLPRRVLTNLKIYTLGQMDRVVLSPPLLPQGGAAGVSIAFSLLVLVGLFADLVRRRRFLDVYILVYLGVVLLWPEVWSDVRFIMPLIPFFLVYAGDAVGLPFELRGSSPVRAAAAAAAAVLLIGFLGLASQLAAAPGNLRLLDRYVRGDRYAGYPPNWRTFFEAADWVKANTPDSAVVTVRKPGLFCLVTGRKVDGYPFTTNADSVLASVRRTNFVVVDQVSGTTGRYLVPAIQKDPQGFKMVFRTGEPYTWVLEVVK
jgi:4-amino-4-deoxy-L-arabinose transferase-like glycosyltransferase